MEYVYAALVLHEAGKDITEDAVTGILEAGDIEVDDARVKSLVAALEDVDIEEAMAQQAAPVAAGGAAPAGDAEEAEEADEEEAAEEAEAEDDDEDEDEGDAGEGLGELFG
jgi:large subunit ribosomal protein L12